MAHKLINLGKGSTGKGVNNKLALIIEHPTLPLGKRITFWATISVDFKEKDITSEEASHLLVNMEEKQNENGKFLLWNGK